MSATVREKPLARKVSEARRIAEATELGKQIGDYRGQKRKPLEVSLKEHIGKFIDNLEADDIIKLTAWVGLAYIIKPSLLEIDQVIQAFQKLPEPRWGKMGVYYVSAEVAKILKEEQAIGRITADEQKAWILALVVSALIIQFGPDALRLMGGMTNLATALVGGILVGV